MIYPLYFQFQSNITTGLLFGGHSIDVGWGIGGALGPATGGIIFDVTNSYSLAFVLFTVVIVMVALLIIFRRFESSP
jgi:cyanate permease